MSRGDHVFYYRAAATYSHHGIDCGDGTVIHYESSAWMKLAGRLAPNGRPRICRVPRAEFALGNDILVRHYPVCDAVDTVIERATSRLGEARYDVVGNNCEHFVVWCKTGRPHSTQVDAHVGAGRAVMRGGPFGAILLRSARYVPLPYRGWAYAGAVGAAAAVYAGTYIVRRWQDMEARVS